MNPELEKSLDSIFAEDQTKRREVDQRVAAAAQRRSDYVSLFRTTVESVIEPALTEFSNSILKHGWSGAIEIAKEGDRYDTGGSRNDSISMVFSSSKGTPRTPTNVKGPTFAIICEPDKREIRFHGTTTNSSGPISTPPVNLETISRLEIQKLAVSFLERLVTEMSPR